MTEPGQGINIAEVQQAAMDTEGRVADPNNIYNLLKRGKPTTLGDKRIIPKITIADPIDKQPIELAKLRKLVGEDPFN